jgi:hypothetical protein
MPSVLVPTTAVAASNATGGWWILLPPPTPTPWPGTKPPPPTIDSPLSIFSSGPPSEIPTARPMTITLDLCGLTFGKSLEFFPDGTYARVAGTVLPGGSYSVLNDRRM